MLIQNIKSRNLWLWGETVMPSSETSEANKLKSEIQDLEHDKSKTVNENIIANEIASENKVTPDLGENTSRLDNKLESIQSSINKKQSELKEVQNINSGGEANNIKYTREFTTPFKITALQSIDIQWENPVGESYGLTTNFLQSWHNKPVRIMFRGTSYIGAFGGDTVGNLDDIENKNDIFNKAGVSTVTGLASSFISTVQNGLNRDKSTADAKGKYYLEPDDDIFKINDLLSKYGEGMFYNKISRDSSTWIYLLIENEMGQIKDEKNLSYATFIGHITHFDYKENIQNPFLYDFNCTFVGEPTLTEKVKSGDIKANQDKNSLKLSMVSSNSGFSLGYGF